MALSPEIERLVAHFKAYITYEPLRGEVPHTEFVIVPQDARELRIPPRASLDPVRQAWEAKTFVGSDAVALFIPGRRFDASGTRHGQGGGWYDRFLANVPREWLRIGFCYDDQFSKTPLPREPHDQAMDYVVVVGRGSWMTTLYSSDLSLGNSHTRD